MADNKSRKLGQHLSRVGGSIPLLSATKKEREQKKLLKLLSMTPEELKVWKIKEQHRRANARKYFARKAVWERINENR